MILNILNDSSSDIIPYYLKIPTITKIEEEIEIDFSNIFIPEVDNETKLLFVLDGLDELAFHKEYKIKDVISKLFEKIPYGAKIIITCRRQVYTEIGDLKSITFAGKQIDNKQSTF